MSPHLSTPRYDGRVDSVPRRDVRRGDAAGRPSEAARHASEFIPRRRFFSSIPPQRERVGNGFLGSTITAETPFSPVPRAGFLVGLEPGGRT